MTLDNSRNLLLYELLNDDRYMIQDRFVSYTSWQTVFGREEKYNIFRRNVVTFFGVHKIVIHYTNEWCIIYPTS